MFLRVLIIFTTTLLFSSLTLSAQHTNVRISNQNLPNEPSICINPKNPKQVVAAANLNNVFYSSDGGATWKQTPVSCPYGIWGDPVLITDTTGAFYYLHLSNPQNGSWIDRIVVQKSTDGGKTWSPGTYMGLNGTKAQDKHWMAVNRANNALHVTWTQFDKYGSSVATDSSFIMYARSTDAGQTWTPARRLSKLAGNCVDSDDTAEGAVPCIGPNGEVYVAWSNREKIWFDRSADGGQTWLSEDIVISEQPGGWDYEIPGISRANGLPFTACDLSNGPHHGTIYVNWSDQRNGAFDTDIWLCKSTDGGNTWSAPVQVNDDKSQKHQFFTNMAIDQSTGYLWFIYYDRRRTPDTATEVYMAVSKDGGTTFQNFRVSETPFIPNPGVFFGDYNGISVHNNMVRPVWTRMDNNQLSVWTAIVKPEIIAAAQDNSGLAAATLETMPNPFREKIAISFKLRTASVVSLHLYDANGQKVMTFIDEERREYGKYVEEIDSNLLNLPSGMYTAVLLLNGKILKEKVMHL
jgi:hypothetical protein